MRTWASSNCISTYYYTSLLNYIYVFCTLHFIHAFSLFHLHTYTSNKLNTNESFMSFFDIEFSISLIIMQFTVLKTNLWILIFNLISARNIEFDNILVFIEK